MKFLFFKSWNESLLTDVNISNTQSLSCIPQHGVFSDIYINFSKNVITELHSIMQEIILTVWCIIAMGHPTYAGDIPYACKTTDAANRYINSYPAINAICELAARWVYILHMW